MSSDATAYFPDAIAPEPVDASGAESTTPESEAQPVLLRCETSDEKLLKRVGSGDKEALCLLFRRHARVVFCVACRILKDESEAEDLLQELFLFLFQKASLFDEAKSTGASWIIQMAYHRAIDRRRYLGARHHYTTQEFHEQQISGSSGQLSMDGIDAAALLEKLRDELSPEQQRTLELHLFEGYSFHEIAERTGQTFGNVRNHYYRGLERLRSYVFHKK